MRWEEYLEELYEGNYETTENYMGIVEMYCFTLMKINIRKTKVMVVNKDSRVPIVNIQLDDKTIDQVRQYKYLGSTLTSDSRCSVEIRHRIAMTKRAFIQKKKKNS